LRSSWHFLAKATQTLIFRELFFNQKESEAIARVKWVNAMKKKEEVENAENSHLIEIMGGDDRGSFGGLEWGWRKRKINIFYHKEKEEEEFIRYEILCCFETISKHSSLYYIVFLSLTLCSVFIVVIFFVVIRFNENHQRQIEHTKKISTSLSALTATTYKNLREKVFN
jgi:hypothetical protein